MTRGRVKAVVDGRPTYRKQAPATMACFYLTLYARDGLRNNISSKVLFLLFYTVDSFYSMEVVFEKYGRARVLP
jgi:hypothetical protein